jgi:hypothetical protein
VEFIDEKGSGLLYVSRLAAAGRDSGLWKTPDKGVAAYG